jgi:hypothetical protein
MWTYPGVTQTGQGSATRIQRTQHGPVLDLGECASQMATPASCGLLLLSALVLAAERIAASDRRRPAVGEDRVPDQTKRRCLGHRVSTTTTEAPGRLVRPARYRI